MAVHELFTLPNIGKIDQGKLIAAFDVERERVVKDCIDRPENEKPRTVSIVFTFAPELDLTKGVVDCDKVNVEVQITSAVPKRISKIYTMTPRNNGSLTFHPDLPEEPEGSTLYDEDQKQVG